jgi:alanine dehydrogenase
MLPLMMTGVELPVVVTETMVEHMKSGAVIGVSIDTGGALKPPK